MAVISTALARFSDAALPWSAKLRGAARTLRDAAWKQMAGEDIDHRLELIKSCSGTTCRVDPFGLDLETSRYVLPIIWFLYRKYFRVTVHGIEHVPDGRVMLVANHSGQLPIDGAMIGAALFFDTDRPRIVRSMVEKFVQTQPFLAVLFTRMGQVVGVPENARRLLELGECVLVFPEGSRGISKPFSQRYRLTEFGLGFMRLALETNTPIVPIAVVGAEEQYINLVNLTGVAKSLGLPAFPIVPQWFVPGLQAPLPTKYTIYFGEPMRFEGDPDDDDAVVEEKVFVVKQTIQSMLNRGLKERTGWFLL